MATNLTDQEIARAQLAIDSGTVWNTPDGSRFAMRLIAERKCSLAPGVLVMFPLSNGTFEPVYSQDSLNRRLLAVLGDPVKVEKLLLSREYEEKEDEILRLSIFVDDLRTVTFFYNDDGEPWGEEYEYDFGTMSLFYTREHCDLPAPYCEAFHLERSADGDWVCRLKKTSFDYLIESDDYADRFDADRLIALRAERLTALLEPHPIDREHKSAVERGFSVYSQVPAPVRVSMELINRKYDSRG